MSMENPFSVAWETHVGPPRIPSISSDHLHEHTENGTGVTHLGIHRHFQRIGWMHKAYFFPVNTESHDAVARWLGWKLDSNNTSL